jgi:hypothetical protein
VREETDGRLQVARHLSCPDGQAKGAGATVGRASKGEQ